MDILQKLYSHFYDAQGFFQGMTASLRITGEISRADYESKVITAMDAARDELPKGRLFIPSALAEHIVPVQLEMEKAFSQ